jgi:hypothetical protein
MSVASALAGAACFPGRLPRSTATCWQFNGYALAADIGYRALSTNVNFSNGANNSNLDLVIHGPLIGMTVKF